MGVGTSVQQSVTLEWLMSESHRVIRQLSSLISVTREIVITELDNLDNRAQTEVNYSNLLLIQVLNCLYMFNIFEILN